MSTPRKFISRICVVCKTTSEKIDWRSINSESGHQKKLSFLLTYYGDINVIEGYICRGCERKLLNIDKSVCEFRLHCKKNFHLVCGKRCSPKESNLPIKTSRVKLFNSNQVRSDSVNILNGGNTEKRLKKSELENRLEDSFEFSPLLCSTPNIKEKLILPKIVKTVDSGYYSFIDSSSESRDPDGYKTQLERINDHSYTTTENKCRKKKNKKDSNIPKVFEGFVRHSVSKEADYLSAEECSLIQATLPQQSQNELVKTLFSISSVKRTIKNHLLAELSQDNVVLRSRKAKKSQLMEKGFQNLKSFCWEDIISELTECFPFLTEVLLAVVVPDGLNDQRRNERLSSILPKVGMVYAILAQARNAELSKVQRCISMLLFDSLCDQKVFDRLHPLGLCMSYSHSLTILDLFGGSFDTAVIDAVKKGKKFRIVGDNVNWKTGVHDERRDHHAHLNHAFGSAIIIQNVDFSHLSTVAPQCPYTQMTVNDFVLSSDEWDIVKFEYAVLICRVVGKHIPALAFVKDYVPKVFESQYSEQLKELNQVIPLPLLHLNEQKYDDVVKIMDYYENFIESVYTAAEIPTPKVHTGGDQLTRERLSGGKRLRAGGVSEKERFEHLSPITFELFHLMMNYTSLMFKQLYKSTSGTDLGTMKCEQNRILRTGVNENVNENYDADKDFINSFVDSYIVESVLDYFNMQDMNSVPERNIPPQFANSNEASNWVKEHFTAIVDQYVGRHSTKFNNGCNSVEDDGLVMSVSLADGSTKTIHIKKKTVAKDDHIKNYGHLVLELGLMFRSLLDLCKNPNRNRGLRLMKIAMVHFKANNNLSKYAYEILRFLVHQKSILSEKAANEEFYGLFVNTKGGINCHIPCDLQMEFIVKQIKRNIKHMYSNKTEKNITVRTSALPALNDIAENFDKKADVLIRAKKHSDADSLKDEVDIMNDLRKLKPFQLQPGRTHVSFPHIAKTISAQLNSASYNSWIQAQVLKYATEIGV